MSWRYFQFSWHALHICHRTIGYTHSLTLSPAQSESLHFCTFTFLSNKLHAPIRISYNSNGWNLMKCIDFPLCVSIFPEMYRKYFRECTIKKKMLGGANSDSIKSRSQFLLSANAAKFIRNIELRKISNNGCFPAISYTHYQLNCINK